MYGWVKSDVRSLRSGEGLTSTACSAQSLTRTFSKLESISMEFVGTSYYEPQYFNMCSSVASSDAASFNYVGLCCRPTAAICHNICNSTSRCTAFLACSNGNCFSHQQFPHKMVARATSIIGQKLSMAGASVHDCDWLIDWVIHFTSCQLNNG